MSTAEEVVQEAVEEQVQSQSVGFMIDKIYALKQDKRDLEKKVKDINTEIDALELKVMAVLEAQGGTGMQATVAKCSIVEDEFPNPEDWDAIHQYIKENDAFYLLQRRLTSTTWNELKKQGIEIPGIRAVTKRTLSVTKR